MESYGQFCIFYCDHILNMGMSRDACIQIVSLISALVQQLLKVFVGGAEKRSPPGGIGLRRILGSSTLLLQLRQSVVLE